MLTFLRPLVPRSDVRLRKERYFSGAPTIQAPFAKPPPHSWYRNWFLTRSIHLCSNRNGRNSSISGAAPSHFAIFPLRCYPHWSFSRSILTRSRFFKFSCYITPLSGIYNQFWGHRPLSFALLGHKNNPGPPFH